ncbi:MAG TPA: hypothetical protein VII11_11160, partial [Bacteroidota bacterium]
MSTLTIADLLGVRGKSIQWERPFLFFGALFLSYITHLYFFVSPQTLEAGYRLSRSVHGVLPPSEYLNALIRCILLAGVAFAAFRWIPNNMGAIVAVAIGSLLIDAAVIFITVDSTSYWSFREILPSVVWTASFFVCIAIALQKIEKLWIALLLGVLAGVLVRGLFRLFLTFIEEDYIVWERELLPFVIPVVGMAVFFWAGLVFSSGKSHEANESISRLSRGFYAGTISVTYGIPTVVLAVALLYQTFSEEQSG